tara:strand:- start:1309 stop:2388 length:1080 start_codon:yes stop_codon:yes gene_type:complete
VPRGPKKFNLQGILSLFSNMTPKWLTDLISNTKGAEETVDKITQPYQETFRGNDKLFDMLNDMANQSTKKMEDTNLRLEEALKKLEESEKMMKKSEDFLKDMEADELYPYKSDLVFPEGTIPDKITLDDLSKMSWEEAQKYGYKKSDWEYMQQYKGKDYETEFKKEGYTWNEAENKWQKIEFTEDWSQIPDEYRPVEFQEKAEGYDKAVKEQMEKEKKKGIFTLLEGGKDEDNFAGGGIKGPRFPKMHNKDLMKSLLRLGTTMGYSEKELLEMAIKFNWDVSDKLKEQYGITDDSLKTGSDKGLEWLLLKANPELAQQPYSQSKVNKMLSRQFDEEDIPPFQPDLFEKKNGGLISLVNG